VLSAHAYCVGGRRKRPRDGNFELQVGGLDSGVNEHLGWATPSVKVGDVICVQIVETEDIDPECERHPSPWFVAAAVARSRQAAEYTAISRRAREHRLSPAEVTTRRGRAFSRLPVPFPGF
jgi:hypothetical protein